MALVADTAVLVQSATLQSDVVNLWRAKLDVDQGELQTLEDLISAAERRQADCVPVARYRARLIAARGIRRLLLSHYLKCDPEEISFTKGTHGKPELSSGLGDQTELRFNMSHSGGFALYAVTSSRQIGVDVEQLRPELADAQTATSMLAPSEVEELKRLPAHQWLDGFFSCWTRKEAYLKATGEGLSVAVNSFAVSAQPGPEAALLEHRDPAELKRWTLRSFRPIPGFIASLAVEGVGVDLRHLSWDQFRDSNLRMVDR